MKRIVSVCAVVAVAAVGLGHDVWVEPSVGILRSGDWVRLSVMLGNHGNEHRDFKLASKVAFGDQNLTVISPKGQKFDLTPSLVDTGYTPQEGFWSTRFQPEVPGMYMAVSTMDKVMSYAPVRDIKCAKSFFVVSKSMDKVPTVNPGFDKAVGAQFELVPVTNPVTPMGPGTDLKVKVLFRGKPMAGVKVGFVPRGADPKGTMDPAFEKVTSAAGTVQMTLKEANTYLIAAHYADKTAKGDGYESINYSATICIVVPGICPCCVG